MRGNNSHTRPPSRPSLIPSSRSPFSQMSPDEMLGWIRYTRTALLLKIEREQAYLDRRTRRGVHTPTDDAYGLDQWLQADIVAFLNEMEQQIDEAQEGQP